jgi:tetratricopeptide (TPR) repeat protein
MVCAVGRFVASEAVTRRADTLAFMARDRDEQPRERARLRIVRGGQASKPARKQTKGTGKRRAPARPKPERDRRRRSAPRDVRDEIRRLAGRNGDRYYRQLAKGADALARDHERDAIRILRPLRDALPDSPSVRELLGLAYYRDGKFPAASKELEEFVRLTQTVEQHPVLMDCYRAQKRWRRVADLWTELSKASPPPELATEGRIVAAGALADRGRVEEALNLLGRRVGKITRAHEHHLRLWYALADLEERAGNIPRARALFDKVRSHDAGFAAVAERLAALGRSG